MNEQEKEPEQKLLGTRLDYANRLALLEKMTAATAIGIDSKDSIADYLIRGTPLGSVTMYSASSGGGKTAYLIDKAYRLAQHGAKVALVSIEQDEVELLRMLLSRATSIDRRRIPHELTEQERKLIDLPVDNGAALSNIYLYYIEDIYKEIPLIVEEMKKEGISYLCYDYVSSESCLYTSSGNIPTSRDDLILKFLIDYLKKLAINNNIAILTCSQLNFSAKGAYVFRTAQWLRGTAAIADKIDAGIIAVGPSSFTDAEKKTIEDFNIPSCNLILDIYKNRRGPNSFKVYRSVDFATFRTCDLMATDAQGQPVSIEAIGV